MRHLSRRRLLNIGAIGTPCAIGGSRLARARMLEDDSFKQEVIEILRRHHPEWVNAPLKNNADPFLIDIGDHRISLQNIVRIVHDMSGREREKRILDFLETAFSVPQISNDMPYDEIKSHLMLQIIPAEYKDQMPNLISRPFFSGLHVGYALKESGGYSLVLEDVLAAWHISQEAVEKQAMANLEALTAQQQLVAKKGEKGAYLFIEGDDSYGAARLLAPGFMARVRETLDAPRIFVGIPDRDFGLAWTPDFLGRQGFAAKIRQDAATEPYSLTDDLFVSSDAGIRLATVEEAYDHGR